MRLMFLALVLTALVPDQALSQTPNPDPVIALEERWAEALVEKDRATVAGLTDPRFRIVELSDAKPISREQYLEMSGITVRDVAFEPVAVTYHGDTAVIVMNYSIDWSIDGVDAEMPREFRVIDLLHRTDGEWLVVSRLSEIQPNP